MISRDFSAVGFPPGASACAALLRGFDWSQSSLGHPEAWPAALKLAAGTVLNAPSPMGLLWGSETILLYNDRYGELIGDNHPTAFGKPAHEVFGDIWSEMGPLIERVLEEGRGQSLADRHLVLDRSGVPEDAWFTFDFAPIFDADGRVLGMLNPCVETTREVAVARRDAFRLELETRVRGLGDPLAMAQGVIDALGNLLGASSAAFGEMVEGGRFIRVEVGYGDGAEAAGQLIDLGALGARALETLPAAATFVGDDLEQESGGDAEAMGMGACVAVPVVRDGAFRGAFLVGRAERRRWSDADINLCEEVTGLVWEVLARAQVQSALTTTEAHWRGMFARLHEGIVMGEVVRDEAGVPVDWRLVDMNSAWEDLSGLSRDGAAGRLASDLLPQADLGWSPAALAVASTGEPAAFTCQLGPQRRWFEGHAFSTAPDQFAVLFLDVTDRRLAQAALLESEDHYRHVVELDPQTTWTADRDGRIDRVNARWTEWTGRSDPAEFWDSVHEDDRLATLDAWAHSVATGEPLEVEHRMRMRDGAFRWTHSRAFPRRDAAGAIVKWYGATEDIHDRWTAQQLLRDLNDTLETQVAERTAALSESQAQLRAMFETSYQYQGLLSLDGRVVDANATSLKGIEAALDEVRGRLFWDTPWFSRTPGLQPAVRTAVASAAAGQPVRREMTLELPSGEHVFDFSFRPVWDAAGKPVAIVPEAVEITERRRAEQALRQSQKMEAVGQLTGGIAHDFNNMLAVVIGSLDLLSRRLGEGDLRARRYVDAATDGARRAALLTQRLLAFSRQQPLNPQALDANRLIAGLSELIRGSVGADVRVELSLEPSLWRVNADANQLENVLLNLAVNARDAMPDGGVLRLETRKAWLEEDNHALQSDAPAGEYVRVSVVDSGQGMSTEVIARAFDPFFTTKEVGKGTGLGLSQVYGFVTQSGGRVEIDSEPGAGTTVSVYLPRFEGDAGGEGDLSGAQEPPLARRREIVLVVEDEAAVRQLSIDVLSELGYATLVADGAASALALVRDNPDIDLMFTDIVMPQVNGRKLAEEARRLRPGLKVLFTTGYTRDQVADDWGAETVIAKPFTLEQLAAHVRRRLDDPA